MTEPMSHRRNLKSEPAWFGIDSLYGRYLTGTAGDIERGLVSPRETVRIARQAHVQFQGDRLFVKSDCAPAFLIHHVFVGNQASGGIIGVNQPIIAEPFAVKFEALADLKLALDEKSVLKIEVDKPALDFIGAPFPLPMLHVGLELMFVVENIGKEPMRFLGAMLGRALW